MSGTTDTTSSDCSGSVLTLKKHRTVSCQVNCKNVKFQIIHFPYFFHRFWYAFKTPPKVNLCAWQYPVDLTMGPQHKAFFSFVEYSLDSIMTLITVLRDSNHVAEFYRNQPLPFKSAFVRVPPPPPLIPPLPAPKHY